MCQWWESDSCPREWIYIMGWSPYRRMRTWTSCLLTCSIIVILILLISGGTYSPLITLVSIPIVWIANSWSISLCMSLIGVGLLGVVDWPLISYTIWYLVLLVGAIAVACVAHCFIC